MVQKSWKLLNRLLRTQGVKEWDKSSSQDLLAHGYAQVIDEPDGKVLVITKEGINALHEAARTADSPC